MTCKLTPHSTFELRQQDLVAQLKLMGFRISRVNNTDNYKCYNSEFVFEIYPGTILAWCIIAGHRTQQEITKYNVKSILEFMESFNADNEN